MADTFSTEPALEAAPFDAAAALACARVVAQRQVEMLGQLAEIGLNLAGALERQVLAEDPAAAEPVPRGDVGLTYSRIARAVRMTLALQSKVLEDHIAREQGAEAARQRAQNDGLEARRTRIGNIVARAMDDETPDGDTAEAEAQFRERFENLAGDIYECLQDEDAYGDILQRPMGEVVALVCKDLGLQPDWDRWAAEPWAIAEAASGAPGSPFARRGEGTEGAFTLNWRTGKARAPPLAGELSRSD
jgi:hypothetical protein